MSEAIFVCPDGFWTDPQKHPKTMTSSPEESETMMVRKRVLFFLVGWDGNLVTLRITLDLAEGWMSLKKTRGGLVLKMMPRFFGSGFLGRGLWRLMVHYSKGQEWSFFPAGMTDALVSIIDTALVSVDESCEKLLLGSIIRLKRARCFVLKSPWLCGLVAIVTRGSRTIVLNVSSDAVLHTPFLEYLICMKEYYYK